MKMNNYAYRASYVLASAMLILSSCQKNDLAENTDATTSNTIAVAASATALSTTSTSTYRTDSVYLLQSCGKGGSRDSISQSALPSSALSYLVASYAGYTFHKAFAIKNSSAVVTGYVAVIYFNDKPVGIQFDSAGNFVKVLEQRERGDLSGPGHHQGGRFEHRDGKGRDSVALSALPSAITSYFSANYASDTLVKAFRNRDSSIVVLSKNNGVFATVFSAAGSFIKRNQLNNRTGNCQPIELAALPSAAANYLATTYPNYVFRKAFAVSQNGAIKGYVVFIDANTTNYAVEFDVSGNFLSVKAVQ